PTPVPPGGWGKADQVGGVKGTKPAEIEDGAEVDEEGIVARAGKHLDAARQILHHAAGTTVVARGRARTDVGWRNRQAGSEHGAVVTLDPRDGVRLLDAEIAVRRRRHLIRVVEEGVRVRQLRRER